jgi:hypothetical protein
MQPLRKYRRVRKSKMETHVYDIPLRVLLYKEDGEFVAHALEMDLIGYGATQKAATEDLTQMVFCQISFAHQKQDAGLLTCPAPKDLFDRWDKAREAALKKEVLKDKPLSVKYFATCIQLPAPKIKKAIANSSRFSRLNKICAPTA